MNKKWKEPVAIIGILTVIITVASLFKVSENPNLIENAEVNAPLTQVKGDINAPFAQINGDVIINKPLPQRTLNDSERTCLFEKINKFSQKEVEVQLETVPIRQNGMNKDGQYYDSVTVGVNNEIRNFSDEIVTYLLSKKFIVTNYMTLGDASSVAKGVTISATTSKVRVLVGENDGTSICD